MVQYDLKNRNWNNLARNWKVGPFERENNQTDRSLNTFLLSLVIHVERKVIVSPIVPKFTVLKLFTQKIGFYSELNDEKIGSVAFLEHMSQEKFLKLKCLKRGKSPRSPRMCA